jgi:hypothetical protein
VRNVFALLALASATTAYAQALAPPRASDKKETPAESADRQAIAAIADTWIKAYNAGDAAKVAALYMPDGYYLSSHVLAHGRNAIEAYFRRGIVGGGHLDFIRPLTTFSSGELGYFAGTYQATNAGVTVDGRILLVFRRINGKWLIAAHETAVRDQP